MENDTREVFSAIKENNLVVTVEPGHQRLAVELFPYKDGAVFFDVGWTESSGHPIHVLPGPISGEYPRWEFGDPESDEPFSFFTVEVFDRAKHPQLIGNNDTWAAYQAHEDGKHATTERAYGVFKGVFRTPNR
jgi:hypothetical protein